MSPTPTLLAPLDGSGGGVIVFASWQRSDWQIFVMNADGSGQRQITNGSRGGYEPNWSPDGIQIIFQYNGLWIADVISGEISRLPLSVEGNNLENEYLVKPAWSPTGEWIAFLNENGTQGDIYLIRPDGSDLARLTTSNDISRDGNLVWSPDGSQLAYSADRDGNIEIYVMDVEAALQGETTNRQLTDDSAPVRNLVSSWSPDGSRIAFSSDRDGNTELYFMSPEGGNVVRLTDDPASDTEPHWSPDGTLIAFTSNRDGDSEIYVLDVDATIQNGVEAQVRRLTNHPGEDVGPVWMPVR
jgi:Tol biopolymer transport system component